MTEELIDHRKKSFYVDGCLVTASFAPERTTETLHKVRSILLNSAAHSQIRQEAGRSNKMGACVP